MKISHLLIISVFIILVSYLGSFLLKKGGKMISQNIEAETFSGVNNKIGANVYIIQGSDQSISVKANENVMKDLRIEVKGGVLVIDKKARNINFDSIVIRISMKELKSLKVDGSGNISTNGVFNSEDDVELNIFGSGNIDAFINTTASIKPGIYGSGNIDLKGKSSKFESIIQGSGNISAFDLKTSFTTINIDGSGNCEIATDSILIANINGSGSIYYKGTPKVNTNINGSGEVQNSK
jgi:hypothetical protein